MFKFDSKIFPLPKTKNRFNEGPHLNQEMYEYFTGLRLKGDMSIIYACACFYGDILNFSENLMSMSKPEINEISAILYWNLFVYTHYLIGGDIMCNSIDKSARCNYNSMIFSGGILYDQDYYNYGALLSAGLHDCVLESKKYPKHRDILQLLATGGMDNIRRSLLWMRDYNTPSEDAIRICKNLIKTITSRDFVGPYFTYLLNLESKYGGSMSPDAIKLEADLKKTKKAV